MAARVEFHTGVADDLGFACRLLRKASRQGAWVLVRGPSTRLARLDRELWTFVERDFLPHVRFTVPGAVPQIAARTAIWLVDGNLPTDGPPVLVNLGADLPNSFEGFTRIIEIVAADADDEQRGRQRWRMYRSMGLEVKHHANPAGGVSSDG